MGRLTLEEVIEPYRASETALVSDVLDSTGLPNRQLSLDNLPLHDDFVLAGGAFTCKAAVGPATAKLGAVRVNTSGARYDMLDALYQGCALVEDVGNGPVSGRLGENMGLSVQDKGCVGVVCDGGTRDKKALVKPASRPSRASAHVPSVATGGEFSIKDSAACLRPPHTMGDREPGRLHPQWEGQPQP
jgi:regulator of RNase E activity RraA